MHAGTVTCTASLWYIKGDKFMIFCQMCCILHRENRAKNQNYENSNHLVTFSCTFSHLYYLHFYNLLF